VGGPILPTNNPTWLPAGILKIDSYQYGRSKMKLGAVAERHAYEDKLAKMETGSKISIMLPTVFRNGK